MSVANWRVFYRNIEGLNIIPAVKGAKFPTVKWYKYRNEFVDEETFNRWESKLRFENIFVILGEISNNLVEFDVDVTNIDLESIFEDVDEAKKNVWIGESSNGKKKIYARAKTPRAKDDQIVSNEKIGVDKKGNPTFPHVEYRGNGHGSILPPSTHPSGIQYKWLNLDENGELPNLPEIDADKLYNKIVERLRKKFDYKEPERKKSDGSQVKKKKGRPRFCYLQSKEEGDEWNGTEGHDFRVSVAAELIHKNWTDEEIHEFFKQHDEKSGETYKQDITQKQIDYSRRTKQFAWLCDTLKKKCGTIVEQYCLNCPRTKQEDLTIYVSTFPLPDGKHLEEIMVDGIEKFVVYDKKTGACTIEDEWLYGDTPIKPYKIDEEMKDAVILPDGVEEYGTLEQLRNEILIWALSQYDPVDNPEMFEAICILLFTSWISPIWQRGMSEKFIPIINARGPSETGKKRFLTIARWGSYHSLYSVKTNRVPSLFRAIPPLEGTLVIDEADMNDSSLSNDLVEYLNSRADGVPISRFNTDNKKNQWWNSFGLTVMATRAGFSDDGLESRCTVMPTATTDNPEKYHLIPPDEWTEKGKEIQRKLLLFRLRHLDGKMPTQLLIPNIKSFRVREALLIAQGLKEEDPQLFESVTKLAKKMEERIIKERAASPEGLILNVIYNTLADEDLITYIDKHGTGWIIIQEKTYEKEGKEETIIFPLTLKSISKSLGEAFSPSQIAKMWRGFNQDTVAMKRIIDKRYRGLILIKDVKRLDKILPKYVPDYTTPSSIKNEVLDIKETTQIEILEGDE